MGHTGQHQEQTQFRQPAVTEHRRDAQPFGHPLQHEEQSKDRSQLRGQRQVGGLVEFAAQQAAQGLDAGGRPVGEIGQGAILDLAVLAEGFAQEEGGWGVAVGDGGDVHDFCISHTIEHVKINIHTT